MKLIKFLLRRLAQWRDPLTDGYLEPHDDMTVETGGWTTLTNGSLVPMQKHSSIWFAVKEDGHYRLYEVHDGVKTLREETPVNEDGHTFRNDVYGFEFYIR